ncbi:Rieske 2Fe-2S domain-containing protein [Kribbella sp. GL6]|uniref:Rieske 2Fe-2S domain-containing protein n=1 Tax=Kribbella sp. GL6 TaxID=3419765 RepID=UPI003D00731E
MNPAAMQTMHATIHIDDLWEGDMAPVDVNGTKVLLMNVDGDVRAYQNRCPHQAWALDEGDFDGATLTCVRHMWQFDAASGQGVNPDDCSLSRYPCEVGDDGMIRVDVG